METLSHENHFLLLFLVFAIAAFSAAAHASGDCADELGCVEIAPDEKITFGGILRLSGPEPWTGNIAVSAFQLAALAHDGMLLGREIELVLEDSACSEEGGREAALRMVADPAIVGIIGTNCSLVAKGASPVISEAGFLMISPSNSSSFLTNADREAGGLYQPGYFRSSHNDLFQGALSAQFAAMSLGVSTVVTIDDGDPYTMGLASAMADTFVGLGGDVVFRGKISKGATDMSELLRAIAQSGADLVYFPLFAAEAALFVEQLNNAPELEDIIMMTADGAFAKSFAQGVGEAGIGLYVAAPHVAGAAYDDFVETWKREIDEAGPTGGFHAHGYDAANLLLRAVAAVASERADGALVIGRGALRAALSAVEDYDGLTGALTCQDESPYAGDCATGEALAIFQLSGSEVNYDNWPPPVVWTAGMAEGE
ncbi:MAG: branched-chain amino acid ABC transporter substrate-binding protein [Chloroflexi bacterium]|nr:branched-chain amino acid ABC transporter substrate-binding protein [Chloroflexota bacterium]